MPSPLGEQLTVWTIRASLVLYVAALLIHPRRRAGQPRSWAGAARGCWTAAWGLLVVHVLCAFATFHGWSHAAAWADTAQKTERVVGWNWGGGVYVNYALLVVWGGDVLWWWVDAKGYLRRSWWIEAAVQGFIAFIALNATVVFEEGWIRWAGVLAGCAVIAAWCARRSIASP